METVTKCSRALWQFIAYIRRRGVSSGDHFYSWNPLISKTASDQHNDYKNDLIFQTFVSLILKLFFRTKCSTATNKISLKSCHICNITSFTVFLVIVYCPNLIASSVLNFTNIYTQKWWWKISWFAHWLHNIPHNISCSRRERVIMMRLEPTKVFLLVIKVTNE